jgi:maleamate amidohydrolase
MNQGFSGRVDFGEKPALLIRDFTVAFLEPHSTFSIEREKQVEVTKNLIESAQEHRIPVIFSITVYDSGVAASRLWCKKFPSLQILIPDSPWVQMIPELEHYHFDLINKTPYVTDFYKSPIPSFLSEHQIDTIVLAGATTSGSIRATAVDALQQGYHVIVAKEAVGDRNNSLQTSTLLDLNARYADVVLANQILHYFESLSIK